MPGSEWCFLAFLMALLTNVSGLTYVSSHPKGPSVLANTYLVCTNALGFGIRVGKLSFCIQKEIWHERMQTKIRVNWKGVSGE